MKGTRIGNLVTYFRPTKDLWLYNKFYAFVLNNLWNGFKCVQICQPQLSIEVLAKT